MSRTMRKYMHGVRMCAHVNTHVYTGKELKMKAFREMENGSRNCVTTDKNES